MPDTTEHRGLDPRAYSSITSPIPLLALFGGVVELLIAALVFKMAPQNQPYLMASAVFLPLAWLVVIFILIARYHQNLYAPADFSRPEHFLATMPNHARELLEGGTLGKPSDFSPFKFSGRTTPKDFAELQRDILMTHWTPLLNSINATEFLALHAWYNEIQNHSLALVTMNVAIARGFAASKNYSFASASLRKLGRLVEAKAFTKLALQLDRENIDAKYNLALISKEMGETDTARQLAKDVLALGSDHYKARIAAEFPELE